VVATAHDHDAKIYKTERGILMSDETKPGEVTTTAINPRIEQLLHPPSASHGAKMPQTNNVKDKSDV